MTIETRLALRTKVGFNIGEVVGGIGQGKDELLLFLNEPFRC